MTLLYFAKLCPRCRSLPLVLSVMFVCWCLYKSRVSLHNALLVILHNPGKIEVGSACLGLEVHPWALKPPPGWWDISHVYGNRLECTQREDCTSDWRGWVLYLVWLSVIWMRREIEGGEKVQLQYALTCGLTGKHFTCAVCFHRAGGGEEWEHVMLQCTLVFALYTYCACSVHCGCNNFDIFHCAAGINFCDLCICTCVYGTISAHHWLFFLTLVHTRVPSTSNWTANHCWFTKMDLMVNVWVKST